MKFPSAEHLIFATLLIFLSGWSFASAEPVPKQEKCDELPLPKRNIFSKRGLEDYLIDQIKEHFLEQGKVNRECLIKWFENEMENNSVIQLDGSRYGMGDIVRFTVDRSGNFLATILTTGPGASNGVFTAIFEFSADERVAVIRSGGITEWLKLE